MKKVALIILDGFGIGKDYEGNAVLRANMSYYNSLLAKYPHSRLEASGHYVGLPDGFSGNSEVGHLHLGAGRVVWQPLELINRKIKDGSFFTNKELNKAFENKIVHAMGLCSDGGVHSHIDHLLALIDLANKYGKKLYVHCFLDGRDVPERSALKYLNLIRKKGGIISSIIGRYYAMDRDNNWDRTKIAFELLRNGKGILTSSIDNTILEQEKKLTDYYIPAIKIRGTPNIEDGSSLIFFNFRTDRARQIASLFSKTNVYLVGFSEYEKGLPKHVAFKRELIKNNLAEVLSNNNFSQLRIAETEKYAHVTYFFNSQIEKPYPGEQRIMVPSPKVPSYDLKPEMSSYEITEHLIDAVNKKDYGFILVNYANPDLVGHSGNLEATIKALEHIDNNLSKLIPFLIKKEYVILLTADHGNAEQMLYDDGTPCPSHTTNPVPFILINDGNEVRNGSLIDVAPTILKILGIKKPTEMEGISLL